MVQLEKESETPIEDRHYFQQRMGQYLIEAQQTLGISAVKFARLLGFSGTGHFYEVRKGVRGLTGHQMARLIYLMVDANGVDRFIEVVKPCVNLQSSQQPLSSVSSSLYKRAKRR